MNKVLTLSFAVIMSSAILSTCYAQTEQASVKFRGIATGECLVLIEGFIGPVMPPIYFIGRGTAVLNGVSEAYEYPPSPGFPSTIYFAADGVKASGVISARGNNYMIAVALHSKGEASGFFADEGDANIFSVGILPGGTLVPTMSYKGVYRDGSGTHVVSGDCGFFALPLGPPGSELMIIGAMLFKPNGSILLSVLWTVTDVPIGPGGAITLHAATVLLHSVSVETH